MKVAAGINLALTIKMAAVFLWSFYLQSAAAMMTTWDSTKKKQASQP